MKENTHIGVYGLLIENDKILLIKKAEGPYKNKLDLPGGSFKFKETPEEALKREFKEETNLDVNDFKLYDVDSVYTTWKWNDVDTITHHIGIFYKITKYQNSIKENIDLDKDNNDSLGASFYNINDLTKDNLSLIAILELEKLGYDLK